MGCKTPNTNLLLRIGKQLSNILFTLPDKLVQNFGTVDNLWLGRVEHLADLPGHEGLSRTGRAVEHHT
jgi:hypothetical protein